MKRTGFILCAVAWLAIGCFFQVREACAESDATLFVVPARYSVLQVMFDILRRHDALLVSYQGEPGDSEPVLHAWNGLEWVHVSFDQYQTAGFLGVRPARVVLVGDSGVLPASLATGASQWCSRVLNVERMDSSSLVNAAGQILQFAPADWEWFASRYNMTLKDKESDRRKKSWFDEAYVEKERPESPWQMFRNRFFGASKPAPQPVEAPVEPLPVLDVAPIPPPAVELIEPPPAVPPSSESADAGIK